MIEFLSAFRDGKGQKGDGSRPLDGLGQCPLMLGTAAGNPAGHDLASFRDIIMENVRTFIVDLEG